MYFEGSGDLRFSGTGNTLRCAKALRAELERLGAASEFHRIEDRSEQASERNLILCYPVHGFNAPNSMLRFCRNLRTGGGSVWFLKTSGEPLRLNDASSREMTVILQKKGFSLKGEFHYVMPYNMVFRHSDEFAALMWRTALDRIPAAAKQIAEGDGTIPKPFAPAIATSWLCRIEHWFYPKNGRLYRVDAERCIRCMKCVDNCPTGNIRFRNGRFSFGKSCIYCARCAFQCPVDAIHIGLLDFMRVNGPYDFSRNDPEIPLGKYCKKAYQRYFGRDF